MGKEKTHININKDAMRRLGYEPGSWIQKLKEAVLAAAPPSTPIVTPLGLCAIGCAPTSGTWLIKNDGVPRTPAAWPS